MPTEHRMPTELSRSLQPRHIAMISIGGIIGAGLFVGSSAAIAAAGPGIVVSYLITGTLVFLVMRMLGEMAMALPAVRSFTEFARAGLGSWAGFVAGWLYWYFWMIVVPVEAIAGANILHGWFTPWLAVPAWVLGLVLMGVMTAVNLMSARSYGEFEFWFASIKVAAIVVFIALAAAFAGGLTSPAGPTFGNLTAHGGFVPRGWIAVLAGAVTVYFSLTGAEITTIAAAESQEPARAVAQMSTSVIVRILSFYVGSVFLIVSVVPWDEIRVGESPFTLALTAMHFRWASLAMSAIILTAVLSCLNSAFYVCSRVLFVLAEHGDAPHWLVQLNERRVPTRSVWMGSLAGVLGILAAITSSQTVFAFLVNASGALMVFIYMIVALAHYRLRRERERGGAPAPALIMWLFPWTSYAALAGMAAVLIAMALTPDLARDLWVSVLALAVAVAAFLVVDGRRRARGAAQIAPAAPGPEGS
jgi:GABA permease